MYGMTSISIPLLDNGTTTSRNVVQSVIRNICKATGFHPDPSIVIAEDIASVRKNKDSDKSSINSHIKTEYEYLVFAEITEEIAEEHLLAHAKRNYKYSPLIEDSDLGLRVGTAYLPTRITLSLRFRARSKVFLQTWARKMALREKHHAMSFPLAAQYNYALPSDLSSYIANVHRLTETVAPYGRTLEQYIDLITKVDTVVRSNKSGKYALNVVNERQTGLEGYFESELLYNDKESTEGIHELSGTFVFNYEQVAAMYVKFPIIVHQQPIDQYYIDLWCNYKEPEPTTTNFISNRIVGETSSSVLRDINDDGIYRNIPFESWTPPNAYPYMDTIAVINLFTDGDIDVVNLSDLSDEVCPSYIKEYIEAYPSRINSYRDSPYMISIYTVTGDSVRNIPYTLSPDGSLTVAMPLSLRGNHYIVVSALNDMSKLHNPAIRKFLADKTITKAAFGYIYPELEFSETLEHGKLHTPGNRDQVTEHSFNKLVLALRSTDRALKQADRISPKYIQQANLIARRS